MRFLPFDLCVQVYLSSKRGYPENEMKILRILLISRNSAKPNHYFGLAPKLAKTR